eukprot:jgi/Mesvir1/12279/Mv24034-RA.1
MGDSAEELQSQYQKLVHEINRCKATLYEAEKQSPPPQRDLHSLRITPQGVLYSVWNLSPALMRASAGAQGHKPSVDACTLQEFAYEDYMHTKVEHVFGSATLQAAVDAASMALNPRGRR